MENKQKICNELAKLLRMTRDQSDVKEIIYRKNENTATETATVTYTNGGKKKVYVSMDSGIAMIRDILNAIR